MPARMPPPKRTHIAGDPTGLYLHGAVLAACRKSPERTAIIDSSNGRRISYAEYGQMVMVAIYLPNTWEFCATYKARLMNQPSEELRTPR
jgi:hypothetical protein